MPDVFEMKTFGNVSLVCTKDVSNPLIVLTDAMLPRLVRWCHLVAVHSEGMDRLDAAVKRHFCHPQLCAAIRDFISACDVCKKMKKDSPKHGQLVVMFLAPHLVRAVSAGNDENT